MSLGKENKYHKFLNSVASALGAKLVSALVAFLSLPLTYNYLDGERFGILAAIVTIVGSLSFADLGLGFGLQNRWSEYASDETGEGKRKAISSVFYFLGLVGLCIGCVTTFFLFFGDLSKLIGFRASDATTSKEASLGVYTLLMVTALTFPFTVVQKIQNAKLEGYKTNFWLSIGNCSTFVCLLVVTKLEMTIPFIILATHGVNSFFVFLNFVMEFKFFKNEEFPDAFRFDFNFVRHGLKDGLTYLALQLSSTVLLASNSFLLATFHSFSDVGKTEVGLRLVSLFLIPMEASAGYYLVGINDFAARNEENQLKRMVRLYFLATLTYSVLVLTGIYTLGDFILEKWIGSKITFTVPEILSFGVLGCGTTLVYFCSFTMFSPRLIRSLLILYPFSALFVIALKTVVVDKFMIEGLNYAQFVGLSISFFLPTLYLLRKRAFL